jgi:hypothetical protein
MNAFARVLIWLRSRVGTPQEQTAETVCEQKATEDGQRHPAPVLRAELQIPQTAYDRYDSNKKSSDKLEWWKFRIEVLTLLAVVGYGTVAYLQWRAMNETNNTMQSQFRAQERAYVGIGDRQGKFADFSPEPDKDGKLQVRLYFFNAGHSPALSFSPTFAAPSPPPTPARHNNRYKCVDANGAKIGDEETTSPVRIPAESTSVFFPFSIAPWRLDEIKKGIEPKLVIAGTLEFCDIFGVYHCHEFAIEYKIAPVSDFVWANDGIAGNLCPRSPISDPPYSDVCLSSDGKKGHKVPILRCPQPEEYGQVWYEEQP